MPIEAMRKKASLFSLRIHYSVSSVQWFDASMGWVGVVGTRVLFWGQRHCIGAVGDDDYSMITVSTLF